MKKITWKKQELSSFCLEFSLLLKAGMPMAECFSILEEDEGAAEKKELLQFLSAKTDEGLSLFAAMQESEAFPDYVLKMVMMGEETGHLEETFHALSVYYETRDQLMQSLKGCLYLIITK